MRRFLYSSIAESASPVSGLFAVLLRIDASPGLGSALWLSMGGEKRIVYILESTREPARHYVGLTSDLQRRLAWHNAGQNVHTANGRPWIVIVSLEFRTEAAARAFERYLKSGSGRAFAKKVRRGHSE